MSKVAESIISPAEMIRNIVQDIYYDHVDELDPPHWGTKTRNCTIFPNCESCDKYMDDVNNCIDRINDFKQVYSELKIETHNAKGKPILMIYPILSDFKNIKIYNYIFKKCLEKDFLNFEKLQLLSYNIIFDLDILEIICKNGSDAQKEWLTVKVKSLLLSDNVEASIKDKILIYNIINRYGLLNNSLTTSINDFVNRKITSLQKELEDLQEFSDVINAD